MEKLLFTSHKIADTLADLNFSKDGLASVVVNGKELCIALCNGELFACSAKCPHAGGDMLKGYTDTTGNIVCPVHCYKFSLKTGRNMSGEEYSLKIYQITIMEDGIYAEMQAN